MNKRTVCMLIIAFLIGINVGSWRKEKQYFKRASEIPEKDVFTNQDIEHILYNTSLKENL